MSRAIRWPAKQLFEGRCSTPHQPQDLLPASCTWCGILTAASKLFPKQNWPETSLPGTSRRLPCHRVEGSRFHWQSGLCHLASQNESGTDAGPYGNKHANHHGWNTHHDQHCANSSHILSNDLHSPSVASLFNGSN